MLTLRKSPDQYTRSMTDENGVIITEDGVVQTETLSIPSDYVLLEDGVSQILFKGNDLSIEYINGTLSFFTQSGKVKHHTSYLVDQSFAENIQSILDDF